MAIDIYVYSTNKKITSTTQKTSFVFIFIFLLSSVILCYKTRERKKRKLQMKQRLQMLLYVWQINNLKRNCFHAFFRYENVFNIKKIR